MVATAADDAVVFLSGTLEPDDSLSSSALLDTLIDARWNKQPAPGDLGFDLKAAPGYQRRKSVV